MLMGAGVHGKMQIFFIEYLTVISWVLSIVSYLIRRHLKDYHRNYKIYFINASRSGLFIAHFTRLFFHVQLEELKFRIVDIRDEEGILLRLRIDYFDFPGIERDILENPVFKDVRETFAKEGRIYTFLVKQIANFVYFNKSTIWRGLVLVHVAKWKIKREPLVEAGEAVLFMDRRAWMDEIKRYAAQYGVCVMPTLNIQINRKSFLLWLLGSNIYILKNIYYAFFKKGIRAALGEFISGKHYAPADSSPKLAVDHTGHLNLKNPEFYSDLFFWQQSSLSGKDILITFNTPRIPINEKKWAEIREQQMNAVVLSPKATTVASVPFFYHWPRRRKIPMPKFPSKTPNNHCERKWLRQQFCNYYREYDYWADFFARYNVKVFISWFKYDGSHCVIADALQSVGGVSAIYQRALEEFPSPGTTVACDIVFGFSPRNAEMERRSGSHIPYYVAVGYVGDHRLSLVRKEAQATRRRLQQNGAQRIIAFFDENSGYDSRWHTGHEFMRVNYEFLLEKVLSEPWLGMLIKPKLPSTLRRRLGPVAGLLKRAEETGRCYVFERGALHSSHPPAIAAIAADIVIHGHLAAATAGMEAALAGVPTLLLDREGWPVSSLYRLGKGQVVFTNWEDLWKACKEYWNDPNGIPGFGDWSSMLDELDPFRDGRAAQRIGTYLNWLLDGFKAGLSRETIMAEAAQRYTNIWGKDMVIEVK